MARYKSGNLDQGEFIIINFQEQFMEDSRETMLKEFVSSNIDMKVFDEYYKNDVTGRTIKHPKDIISAIIYGYIQGERSSRKIENLLRSHVGYMYVSNRLCVDHSKICEFKTQFSKVIEELFTYILYILNNNDEIDWNLVVGDGTKIKANASKSKTMSRKKADEVLKTYRRMAAKVVKRDLETDERHNRGDFEDEKYIAEKKRIERQKKLYNRTIDQLETYKQMVDNGELEDGDRNYNLTDPDSSLTKGSDKNGYIQGYNMRMMVSNNDIILSCENDKLHEKYSSKPMIAEVEELKIKLGVTQETEYLMDAGFQNMPDILELEKNGLKCYIDVKEKDFGEDNQKRKLFKPVHLPNGKYQLECAGGQNTKSYIDEKRGKVHFSYNRSQCKGCRNYKICYAKINSKRNQKTVNFELFELENRKDIDNYLKKLRSEEGQKIYSKRIGKEHNFANMKIQKNFLQTFYRGHDKVRTDWLLNGIAHNLNKYFQAVVRKGLKK